MKRIIKIALIVITLVYFVGNILPNVIGIPLAAYHSYTVWEETESNNKKSVAQQVNQENSIKCSDSGCYGTYKGPEFVNGSDVAHQFSNTMSWAVGDKLKGLYSQNKYSKVDFKHIKMTTKGMKSGEVIYYLEIPFVTVDTKCDAYTSFDHVGGWDHTPALEKRKRELNALLLQRHQLDISNLKKTPEGLQEYWIQWKNKTIQSDCN